MHWLYVALGGSLGAISRYAFMGAIGKRWGDAFPYATLATNVIGSFVLGALVALLARHLPPQQEEIRLFVAVGFLGAFTTFSTFSLDVMTLYQRGEWGAACAYMLASVVVSVAALVAGLYLFRPIVAG